MIESDERGRQYISSAVLAGEHYGVPQRRAGSFGQDQDLVLEGHALPC